MYDGKNYYEVWECAGQQVKLTRVYLGKSEFRFEVSNHGKFKTDTPRRRIAKLVELLGKLGVNQRNMHRCVSGILAKSRFFRLVEW